MRLTRIFYRVMTSVLVIFLLGVLVNSVFNVDSVFALGNGRESQVGGNPWDEEACAEQEPDDETCTPENVGTRMCLLTDFYCSWACICDIGGDEGDGSSEIICIWQHPIRCAGGLGCDEDTGQCRADPWLG
jgi:hypothetical protein